MNFKQARPGRQRASGMTLAEVLVSIVIAGVIMAATVGGLIQAMRQAEWSAHSLAANSLALQRIEQARAATWDRLGHPAVDELVPSNFPERTDVLDVPMKSTNLLHATTRTTIVTLSSNPPLKMIRVDCAWHFVNGRLFTNTIVTYRAPNQ
ncbi:MAG: prepilin-type N-terminal cleavage/methylation domain-containing protein [Verrucomicrobiia bacterium]